jgi:DNA-directed RNA polymerase specialized sigma subunit
MKVTNLDAAHMVPDPDTDPMLLPSYMAGASNGEEVGCMKAAARIAMERYLSEEESQVLYMHYWEGMSKAAIGRKLGIGTSAVCKKMSSAQKVLKDRVAFCLDVFKHFRATQAAEDETG